MLKVLASPCEARHAFGGRGISLPAGGETHMIKGTTRLVAIIGSPVVQVKSPENFNIAFQQTGSDVAMMAMDVPSAGVDAFLAFARNWQNLDGFVVTIPHKQAIASGIDSVTSRAALLGAVNVVRRDADGRLTGDMVDGLGFVRAAQSHGFEPQDQQALVIGCGGAGSAIAHALCEAGVSFLAISDSDAPRVERLAAALTTEFPRISIATEIGDPSRYDLVANATPLGMKAGDPLPLTADAITLLKSTAHVADVVTSPEVTPFLEAVRARGLSTHTGPEMAKAQLGLLGAFMGVLGADD